MMISSCINWKRQRKTMGYFFFFLFEFVCVSVMPATWTHHLNICISTFKNWFLTEFRKSVNSFNSKIIKKQKKKANKDLAQIIQFDEYVDTWTTIVACDNKNHQKKTFNGCAGAEIVSSSGNTPLTAQNFLLFVASSIDISLSFKQWVKQVAIYSHWSVQVKTPFTRPNQAKNKKQQQQPTTNNQKKKIIFQVSNKLQPLRIIMPSIINSNLWVLFFFEIN